MNAYDYLKEGKQGELDTPMQDIHKYVDSICDIMEHKFLVFLFNTGEEHWVTMVVVNPRAIFMKSMGSTTDHKAAG